MNKFMSMAIAAAVAIVGCSKPAENRIWLPDGTPEVNAEIVVDTTFDLKHDGFMIKDTPDGRKVMAKTEIGAMYGTYALQRLERTGKADGEVDIREERSYETRILKHW